MKLLILWWIIGFVSHFLTLMVDETEMEDFQELTLKEKIRILILNTSLGVFIALYFLATFIPQLFTKDEKIDNDATVK